MSLRNIRLEGDEILLKRCKEVKEMTPRLLKLLDDMAETMYDDDGVGLAAPQVGVLKRMIVIDVGDGLIELINPVIVATSGSQTGMEGCLSIPGKMGQVTRPNEVTVKALDRNMQEFPLTGTELLARAICHECDHLDGHLYTELVEGELVDVDDAEEEEGGAEE